MLTIWWQHLLQSLIQGGSTVTQAFSLQKTVAALNNLRRILPVLRQKKQAEERQSILTREFNTMYQYLERTGLKV